MALLAMKQRYFNIGVLFIELNILATYLSVNKL